MVTHDYVYEVILTLSILKKEFDDDVELIYFLMQFLINFFGSFSLLTKTLRILVLRQVHLCYYFIRFCVYRVYIST